jgi:hypothetical protein
VYRRRSFLGLSLGKRDIWHSVLLVGCWLILAAISTAVFAQQATQGPPPCAQPTAKVPAHGRSEACPSSSDSGNATAFVVQQPAMPESPPEGKLKTLVPLLQSGLWAILIGVALFGVRKEIGGLIDRAKSVDIGGVKIDTEPEPVEPLSTAIPENVPVSIRFR